MVRSMWRGCGGEGETVCDESCPEGDLNVYMSQNTCS